MVGACGDAAPGTRDASETGPPADLLITNARIYTFAWPDPAREGTSDPAAPHDSAGWHPDAEAVAARDGRIVFVGSSAVAERYRGPRTRVLDAGGATVLPGLVDAHVHIAGLGARLEQVDLVGVETEEEAVARVAERAAQVPPGEWILGWGWDEGAWVDRYPTHEALTAAVPDHPVVLRGLHGFATWANARAMERAGIDDSTRTPSGGEILRDAEGRPSGIFLNRATALFDGAIREPTAEALRARVVAGLREMARAGYVMVHEAGADSALMDAFETLEREERLPIRVYAMLSARDPRLLDRWLARGPDRLDAPSADERLITRSVKGHYDGALGSRGALLLEAYADRPGHRGTGSHGYGYDHERLAALARAGFQPAIHAIGDRGNRETLDFLAGIFEAPAPLRALRPRVEHAQVVHPDDFARFAALGAIASMQPPHMAEDKAWAEDRLGPERIRGAYAWRTFREHGVPLVFSSDLPGSDHDVFYG
ncbi:MAG: amidohydrolase, partial [Gemmatimonadota bacterium]